MKLTTVGLILSGAFLWSQQASGQVTPKPFEKILGTWKEVPGPESPALIKVEPEGNHVKFSFGCKQDGSCPDVIVAKYDGKPCDTSNANWQVSYRKTIDRALQEEGYLNGKLSSTGTWRLSADGNTLTRTYHSISPPGPKDRTFVHERSGGPRH